METPTLSPDRRGLHSRALDLLRFPLAVVIVLVHTFPPDTGFFIMGKSFDLQNFPLFYELLNFIRAFLRGQSVPIYYFISGYVFFLGTELTREKYVQKLRNRTKTLLIPYIIWNAVALALIFLTRMTAFRQFVSNPDEVFNPTLSNIVQSFWNAGNLLGDPEFSVPINGPLWFVRNLMLVVLCTPVIWRAVKRFKFRVVAVLGLLWFGMTFLPSDSAGKLATAFFFFSWGAYMSISRKDMVVEFGRFFKLSLIMFPLLGISAMLSAHFCPEATEVIKQLNTLTGLVFAYNLAVYLLENGYCRVNQFLASSSFFIYVSHALICGKIRTLLYAFIKPASEAGVISVYFMALAATIFLLLGIYRVLKRYMPSLLGVLTGRK